MFPDDIWSICAQTSNKAKAHAADLGRIDGKLQTQSVASKDPNRVPVHLVHLYVSIECRVWEFALRPESNVSASLQELVERAAWPVSSVVTASEAFSDQAR